MGERIRPKTKKEETGGSEVVEITFAIDSKQPPTDSKALANGSDSTVVWTGTVGLIRMRKTNDTLGNNTKEMDTLERGEDISP